MPDLVYPYELPAVDAEALQKYEERADAYDRYLPLTFSTYGEDEQQVRNAMIDKLNPRSDSIVLETGAGTGRDSEIIARRLGANGKLYIQDLSPSFLAKTWPACRASMRGSSQHWPMAITCPLPTTASTPATTLAASMPLATSSAPMPRWRAW